MFWKTSYLAEDIGHHINMVTDDDYNGVSGLWSNLAGDIAHYSCISCDKVNTGLARFLICASGNNSDEVRNAAYEIINRKGATYYGIGMSAARICEAILRDEKSILPVSVLLHGEYGIDDVYLSLPTILGEHGVEKILTPGISDEELGKLHHSAALLKEARAQL